MTPCEATGGIASLVPCNSAGRWVGEDGKVRCSLHHIQKYGHGSALVRVEGYEPPERPAVNGNGEKLPGTHAGLDALAAERGIDLGDATTVKEKQAVIEAAS